MKINVHAGHTKQTGLAPGAGGVVEESIEDRKIVKQLIKILKDRGNTVYDCTAASGGLAVGNYDIYHSGNAYSKTEVDNLISALATRVTALENK